MLEKEPQGSLKSIFAEARKRNIKVQFVDRRTLDKTSEEGRHQGVIAYIAAYEYAQVDDILASAHKKGEPPFLFCSIILKIRIIWGLL